MLTAKDAVQKEKDALYYEIRHMTSLCTCPSYISVEQLKAFVSLLKGEKNEH